MSFDLAIAGAGPAGLIAAERGSHYGLKVALLERHAAATDSLMGELVTDKALRMLHIKPDSDCVGNKFNRIVGESLDTGAHIAVDRTLLGSSYLLDEDNVQLLLSNRAIANGAQFMFKARVDSVIRERNQIVGIRYNQDQDVRASLTVGADGSFSRVSATSGFVHPKWLLSYGYRFKVENCKIEDPHTARFCVGRDVGLGYLWVYPRSETETNLGIGRVPSSKSNWNALPQMKDVLLKYMKEHLGPNARIANTNGGVVPCAGLIPKFTGPGVVLCGNSAGQVSSIVGGGVTTCLHAGTLVAHHAKRMVDNNDFSAPSTSLYEKEYRKTKLAHSIQTTARAMWGVSKYSMLNDPIDAAEQVLAQLDPKTLNDVIQGHVSPATAMSLLTDFLPLVARLAVGYMKSIAVVGP
jgi:flavin-dependent dehydrogenase